jgi:catechol 2,3-dioxygenase-like lactoylglutathione lyase family enzyme
MLSDHPVHATVATGDLAQARKFYEETLGLKVEPGQESEEEGGGLMFRSGSTQLLVYESQFAGKGEQTVATWLVNDFDAVAADLRSRGITFEQYDLPGVKTDAEGIVSGDGFKAAWFKDPDGNILNITQM